MNLPTLIKQIYGVFTLTGLYSFEFVDKNRNTITEIFFMIPPKRKSVDEPTRSSTVPTLGGNYNLDAGNATKMINISGELFFPYVGSPDNPIARWNDGLENTIDGMNEFLSLRWFLIRYRDYTLSSKAKMNIPTTMMGLRKEVAELYSAVSKRMSKKVGALYDEIQLIFHDYDMDDHFYCRVDNFSSSQEDTRHLVVNYNISIECYEPDSKKRTAKNNVKIITSEAINIIAAQIADLNFEERLEFFQDEIGYNIDFFLTSLKIKQSLTDIEQENVKIQAGNSTALSYIPDYVNTLTESNDKALTEFIDTFFSSAQKTLYATGDLSIEGSLTIDMMSFYNTLQKIKIIGTQLSGVINSIIVQEELRYYSNADNYTLTEEQFDEDSNKVENDTGFYFYTVQEGDTARIIASRELQDSEKFINILQLNDITENDFIDNAIIGTKIKIPILSGGIARSDDNLVYETNIENMDAFLYGTDLKTGLKNELMVSGKGDLLSYTGPEVVFDNIEKRIKNRKGSLNVFHPGWGTNPVDDGNAPLMVRIERYLNDMLEQVQSDPRIEYAKLNLNKMIWSGETLTNSININLIGAEESKEVVA